jgi:ATP-binding cassette subfamily B protein
MNAMMNETLNIGGALLVKLFGRKSQEVHRFEERATSVRDIGIHRAIVGASFFVIIGLVSAVGTALVYTFGGYLVIQQAFTVGTIVAFCAYRPACTAHWLARGSPVEFATSVVSLSEF